MKLRAVDYLDWLKDQEEFIVYEMELSGDFGDVMATEEQEQELQLIREIKDIVTKWGEQDE